MPRLLVRATFVIALLGVALILPPVIGATNADAASKKKKSKKAKKAVSATASKKVSAQSILQMHKSGMTDDEIVARAQSSGYKPSARDRAVLKKGKAPKSLIAALDPGAPEEPAAEVVKASKPIDVRTITDPSDIDFDDVAPPSGMPKQFVAQGAPAKKQLDRSTRPSAPFDEKAEAQKASATAKPSSSSAAASSTSSPVATVASSTGKRVVYKPSE